MVIQEREVVIAKQRQAVIIQHPVRMLGLS